MKLPLVIAVNKGWMLVLLDISYRVRRLANVIFITRDVKSHATVTNVTHFFGSNTNCQANQKEFVTNLQSKWQKQIKVRLIMPRSTCENKLRSALGARYFHSWCYFFSLLLREANNFCTTMKFTAMMKS